MATTKEYEVYLNMSNNTTWPPPDYSDENVGDFFDRVIKAYASLLFIMTPAIVVANGVVIASIVTNSKLREKFIYLVIVNIAVADFLIGLLSCPIRGDLFLFHNFEHGCFTYTVVSVIEEYVQIFLGTWGIVTINFDYLGILFHVKLPELFSEKRTILLRFILLLPWLVTWLIIMPVVYTHAEEERRYMCYLHMQFMTVEAIVPLTFIIPGLIIVCQSVVMTVVCYLQKQKQREQASPITPSEEMRMPWVFIAAGLVTVFLNGLEQCGHLALKQIQGLPRRSMIQFYVTAYFLSDAKSLITPLLWFALPELRAAFMELYNRLPWRHNADTGIKSDVATIAHYRNLTDDTA